MGIFSPSMHSMPAEQLLDSEAPAKTASLRGLSQERRFARFGTNPSAASLLGQRASRATL
jgi:hypothetical protein